jgi:HD-GYP domain-containing protein (c-di-GMP phosphodiesterase class II)/DNA-binding CsgD family transcriptional regulator
MSAPPTPRRVRLAELIAMLSLGTDLGMGQPMEHQLRQTLIAVRLAERLGLDEATRRAVLYVSLIAWVGCHVDAYEQAKWFGDDLALRAESRGMDLTTLRPAGDGLRPQEAIENHWLATNAFATALGLSREVRDGLYQTFERWDGKGVPGEAKGEEILMPARLVNLADVVEVFHRTRGVDAAIAVARERSGSQFDPALVDVLCADAPLLLRDIDALASWPAVIAAEPALEIELSEAELESALEAIADFADLKSPWTLGHSRGVAELAYAATKLYGLSEYDAELVRRAGLVHDLGRLGVSNAIWDKRGRLTAAELERVRMHPYLTDRMLASSEALAPVRAIAVQHHERLDGSGYPRGLSGDALTPAGRILAAADAYHAMTEPRPHREAHPPEAAAAELRSGVRRALFDGDAVDAVLRAAGHPVTRRREWPGGLTNREVEVLRLLVRGLSNKEIAEQLVISRRTAGSHVEHIYTKLGVSNRAQASLFAVKHGLMSTA